MKVAILGATGTVGQRIVAMLQGHPWFEISALCASESSAGKKYRDVTHWLNGPDIPEKLREFPVTACDPKQVDADVVLSALPTQEALHVEAEFAKAGFAVSSNASTYRMKDDVPLLIPEVNPEHLELARKQKGKWDGFIVTDPNCSTIQLCIALKPLQDAFGISRCFTTTMQAVSGAGYPGVSSLDIIDNVVPYIPGEEEKIEKETGKILGTLSTQGLSHAPFKVSAHCNRVPVLEGHTESVTVELEHKASIEDVKGALRDFKGKTAHTLPSSPRKVIIVREEHDRPQPRLDRKEGMATVVGRVRKDSVFENGIRFTVLGHNTVRGAAGAALLNAELLKAEGWLD